MGKYLDKDSFCLAFQSWSLLISDDILIASFPVSIKQLRCVNTYNKKQHTINLCVQCIELEGSIELEQRPMN